MRIVLTIFFVISGLAAQAQSFSVTPVIGVKAEISSANNQTNYDNLYFKTFVPRFHMGLSPVLLGANLEYIKDKDLFSIGFVHGDQANSTIRVEFDIKSDDPYSDYQFRTHLENFAGYNVFKLPISYKRELYSVRSKSNEKVIDLRMHLGMNLQFLRIKGVPVLQNPIGFGEVVTLLGDTLSPVSYSGHNNRSFSVSFNLGLDCDFYIKNKRRFNLQLYYEQGTFQIAQSAIAFYKDNPEIAWTGFRSLSRGSSIHLKLGFPIKMWTKRE